LLEVKPIRDYITRMKTALIAFMLSSAIAGAEEPTKLQLISWNWEKTSRGHITIQGLVKNTSGQQLGNVQAVVNAWTSSGSFIGFETALLETRPLEPGETSPFKVIMRYRPSIANTSVSFKQLNGPTIAHSD